MSIEIDKRKRVNVNPKLHAVRAIDKGTAYDVPGALRKWAREIESGEMGRVTDVVVILHYEKDGVFYSFPRARGSGAPDLYIAMLHRALKEWV